MIFKFKLCIHLALKISSSIRITIFCDQALNLKHQINRLCDEKYWRKDKVNRVRLIAKKVPNFLNNYDIRAQLVPKCLFFSAIYYTSCTMRVTWNISYSTHRMFDFKGWSEKKKKTWEGWLPKKSDALPLFVFEYFL